MILLQSLGFENITDDVLDWVYYLKPETQTLRVNDVSEISSIEYNINDNTETLKIDTEDQHIDSNDTDAYWYRRGALSFHNFVARSLNNKLGWESRSYLEKEFNHILENVDFFLSDTYVSINKFADNNVNKLKILRLAKKVGLNIPDTLICTNKQSLFEFIKKHNKIISKVIRIGNYKQEIQDKGYLHIFNGPALFMEENIPELQLKLKNNTILPSLVQQYIDKKFELRVFYFMGKCYSMAIFSQENEKTKVDYRNYDYARPNRNVSYKLPDEVEQKIRDLMKQADLNSGSLDMIYTLNNEYVFLEVNPVGQFQALGRNCNYFLDKELAKFLINS